MSIVYCCITLEENWSDIKCWLLHDLYWTIPVAQANGFSTSISIEVVDKCKMSMLDMDLFTVGDLNALITAMKVSGKQTITMADVASNLGRLKYERTVRASSSSSSSCCWNMVKHSLAWLPYCPCQVHPSSHLLSKPSLLSYMLWRIKQVKNILSIFVLKG